MIQGSVKGKKDRGVYQAKVGQGQSRKATKKRNSHVFNILFVIVKIIAMTIGYFYNFPPFDLCLKYKILEKISCFSVPSTNRNVRNIFLGLAHF